MVVSGEQESEQNRVGKDNLRPRYERNGMDPNRGIGLGKLACTSRKGNRLVAEDNAQK
jgi:hypothetical protein